MSARVTSSVTVAVSVFWEGDERPVAPSWSQGKPAGWSSLSISAGRDAHRDGARISGRGHYLKKDGAPGLQMAEVRWSRLADLPDDIAAQLWDAWLEVAQGAGRTQP